MWRTHSCVQRRRYIPGTYYTQDTGDIVNKEGGMLAAMPWKEHGVMEERFGFIEDWRSQDWTMAELCRFYGVTRVTGYKWVGRYEAGGPGGFRGFLRAAPGLADGRIVPVLWSDARHRLQVGGAVRGGRTGWIA